MGIYVDTRNIYVMSLNTAFIVESTYTNNIHKSISKNIRNVNTMNTVDTKALND